MQLFYKTSSITNSHKIAPVIYRMYTLYSPKRFPVHVYSVQVWIMILMRYLHLLLLANKHSLQELAINEKQLIKPIIIWQSNRTQTDRMLFATPCRALTSARGGKRAAGLLSRAASNNSRWRHRLLRVSLHSWQLVVVTVPPYFFNNIR